MSGFYGNNIFGVTNIEPEIIIMCSDTHQYNIDIKYWGDDV